DLIGPLPESKGYNAIISMIDRYSQMIRLIPSNTELTSMDLVTIYRDQIWKLHGLPKRITSDRGPQFASKLMKELCHALGIEQNMSTAYHPQMDGQVE
ncbi:MAG TPA: transposase family protein, partial [Methylomirabilota bacterium]|nr:transposase family protein [Methylomirabilota bacterium]